MALLNIQLKRGDRIKNIEELIGKRPKKNMKVKSKADFENDFKKLQERMKNAISK